MTMKHVDLNVCVRTKDAICMYRFDTAARTAIRNDSMHPTGKAIQGDCNDCAVAFTESGSHGAFATTQEVVIQDMTTGAQIVLSEKNVTSMCFSPKGTFLVTFYLPGTEAVRNVAIWTAIDGQLITRFQQYVWPAVLWTPNEMYALRQTSNMVTLLKGDVQHPGVLGKIEITPVKGKDFVVALGNTSILLMLPSDSKARREGKIVGYSLPNLEQTVINMTLEELDDGEIKWSPSGDVAIVIARVDFDRSNQSYYGSSRIFLANFRKKKISRVQIKEGTPIHDVVWSSDVHNQEFLVVSGKMPDNDATIFDVHGKSVYHFNQQPRNTVRWSPQKRLFALGGSGSLNGVFQFYDREKIGQPDYQNGKLGSFTMKSLDYEWSPCGEYILTAIVYTRQRAGNKVCIWHYTGECMLDLPLENICEVRWVPNKSLELPDLQELKAAVAAPGAAPKTLFKPRHTSAGAAAILSRSKADVEGFAGSRKIDVKENGLPPGAVVIVNHVPKAKVKPAAKQLSPSITLEEGECPEKKLKTMMKKLRQIEELKGKDKSTLNSEQLDKLKKETQMRCDIAYLETLVSSKKN